MNEQETFIKMIKRTFEAVKKTGRQAQERIFKPFKKLDCEIRIIREEISEERKEVYFIVDVGYYESIGEQGLINCFFYDDIPTEEEVLKDVEEDLKKDFEEYKNKILSGTEEEYLKILEKIFNQNIEMKGGFN